MVSSGIHHANDYEVVGAGSPINGLYLAKELQEEEAGDTAWQYKDFLLYFHPTSPWAPDVGPCWWLASHRGKRDLYYHPVAEACPPPQEGWLIVLDKGIPPSPAIRCSNMRQLCRVLNRRLPRLKVLNADSVSALAAMPQALAMETLKDIEFRFKSITDTNYFVTSAARGEQIRVENNHPPRGFYGTASSPSMVFELDPRYSYAESPLQDDMRKYLAQCVERVLLLRLWKEEGPLPIRSLESEFWLTWQVPLELGAVEEMDAVAFLRKWPSMLVYQEGEEQMVKLVDKDDGTSREELRNLLCPPPILLPQEAPQVHEAATSSGKVAGEENQAMEKLADTSVPGSPGLLRKKAKKEYMEPAWEILESDKGSEKMQPASSSSSAYPAWKPCPLALKLFGTPRGRPVRPRETQKDKRPVPPLLARTSKAPPVTWPNSIQPRASHEEKGETPQHAIKNSPSDSEESTWGGWQGTASPTVREVSSPSREHRFEYSPLLAAKLELQGAVQWLKDKELFHKIVRENDLIVQKGGFLLEGREEILIPPPPKTVTIRVPDDVTPAKKPRFSVTKVCVANVDTVTAAIAVGNALALNFANERTPGGGYRKGAGAQEEVLCRLCPQFHPSLAAAAYPIFSRTALITTGIVCCRQPGTYQLCRKLGEVNFVSAAMPNGSPAPGSKHWAETVNLRIRAVLHASKVSGFPNVILGAFGCGAYGNPARDTAEIFREQLKTPEFKGAFQEVIFAIIDPRGTGNRSTFAEVLSSI